MTRTKKRNAGKLNGIERDDLPDMDLRTLAAAADVLGGGVSFRLQPKGADAFDYKSVDPGIRNVVKLLRESDVYTCQSCEGGPGHAYAQPTVDFIGNVGEGPRVLGIALSAGLRVSSLARIWSVDDGGIFEVLWRIEFRPHPTKTMMDAPPMECP